MPVVIFVSRLSDDQRTSRHWQSIDTHRRNKCAERMTPSETLPSSIDDDGEPGLLDLA